MCVGKNQSFARINYFHRDIKIATLNDLTCTNSYGNNYIQSNIFTKLKKTGTRDRQIHNNDKFRCKEIRAQLFNEF